MNFIKKMSTEAWVIIGAILIGLGTFIIWYFPNKEAEDQAANVKESGKFSKRIAFGIDVPKICFGGACFVIMGDDHIPILTDGKGNGKLYIPSKTGNGDGIIYCWVQDQQMKVSLTIYDDSLNVISYISGNEWVVKKSKTIDCNYDLTKYEVVRIENGNTKVLLQIELKDDNVQIGFETTLKDGRNFFWGNNKMEFTGPKFTTIDNDLVPLFKYPSDKNFGKTVQ